MREYVVNVPSHHLRVVVDWYVGPGAAVVGTKVAVWGPKPLIKTVFQREVLRSVPKMPGVKE